MIIIRDSTESDVPAIQAIYALEVLEGTASFETEPPSVAELGRRRREIVAEDLPYLVAVCEDQIAGYAYAGPYRTRHAYRFSIESSVYVARWAHRRGVGLTLLQSLIQRVRQGSWSQLVAIIGDSNNTPSIELHLKAGFQQVGILHKVGYKHDQWLDTVFMQIEL